MHVIAAVSFAIGLYCLSLLPQDAPVNKHGLLPKLLFAQVFPGLVYLTFIFYGGQRAASERRAVITVPYLYCREPVCALKSVEMKPGLVKPAYVDEECAFCRQPLT